MNMNGAELHLLLNHAPVVGFPLIFLALGFALLRKDEGVFQFAIYLSILIWCTTLASYLTGDPAEHVLKALPDFERQRIHTHEEASEIGLIASSVLAVMAVLALPVISRVVGFLRSGRTQKVLRIGLLFGTLLLSLWLAYVAHLGGLIRHIEIR